MSDELFTETDKDAQVAIVEDDEDSPDDCIFVSQSSEWDDFTLSDDDAPEDGEEIGEDETRELTEKLRLLELKLEAKKLLLVSNVLYSMRVPWKLGFMFELRMAEERKRLRHDIKEMNKCEPGLLMHY